MNTSILQWDHWHIEVSSVCALRCPRCPRAEVPQSLLNQSLNLKFFQQQIGAHIIQQVKKITFCGNDGDPIYCKEFVEICEWMKKINSNIQLVVITNGSYKNSEWWLSLANTLDCHDEIHWSLDGWDDYSNSQYRVNSNWQSIVSGIETFTQYNTATYKVWAAIAFRFNENQIDHMRSLAQQWGFDSFQLTKSTKFGSTYPDAYGPVDTLQPTDPQLIAVGHRYQRHTQTLTNRTRPGAELKLLFAQRAKNLQQHSALCLIGNKGVFLNSRGEFYPCCWTANRYPHNDHWQARFDLNHKTFDQIMADPFWQTEFLNFSSYECKTKCTPDKLQDLEHVSEW